MWTLFIRRWLLNLAFEIVQVIGSWSSIFFISFFFISVSDFVITAFIFMSAPKCLRSSGWLPVCYQLSNESLFRWLLRHTVIGFDIFRLFSYTDLELENTALGLVDTLSWNRSINIFRFFPNSQMAYFDSE